MISGQDLVEWQLRVAAGEPLPATQEQLHISGHAFEARVYAEDPDNDFLPVAGTLQYLQPPADSRHVRIDTGVVQGDEVSVYYDPMIAKLIVWDESRERALNRLAVALRDYRISGLTTNLRFLYNLATSPAFRAADLDTGFIEKHHGDVFHDTPGDLEEQLPLAALFLVLRQEADMHASAVDDPCSPWRTAGGWRLNAPRRHRWELVLNGVSHDIEMEQIGDAQQRHFLIHSAGRIVHATGHLEGQTLHADIDGYRRAVTVVGSDDRYTVFSERDAWDFARARPDTGEDSALPHGGFTAPMNGTIVAVLVKEGESVEAEAGLVIMEAMKMEHTIRAPVAGTVTELFFGDGELVSGGDELLRFEAGEPT